MKNVAVFPLVSPSISIEHLERALWSIESQEDCPFEFNVHIIVNSLLDPYMRKVQEAFGKDYDVVVTDSNGKSGRGHNARLKVFRDIYEEYDYTHMIPLDGDDYFYPMAFKCLSELHFKSKFDYLSGMCPHVDSLRMSAPTDGRPHIQATQDLFVWSFFQHRQPITPYWYWNGESCPGGEPTLCLSKKAIVDCDIHYTDNLGLADDYPHLLRGIISYLNGEMLFVNTDVNDIYVYDCTKDDSSSRKQQDFDSERGWPFDAAGELQREIEREEFKILDGITRLDLPYATLRQYWNEEQKAKYVMENAL
jgi:hypothetical protein